jgi:hypothetical protein
MYLTVMSHLRAICLSGPCARKFGRVWAISCHCYPAALSLSEVSTNYASARRFGKGSLRPRSQHT